MLYACQFPETKLKSSELINYRYKCAKEDQLTCANASADVHLDTFVDAYEKDAEEHYCRKAHKRQKDGGLFHVQ